MMVKVHAVADSFDGGTDLGAWNALPSRDAWKCYHRNVNRLLGMI